MKDVKAVVDAYPHGDNMAKKPNNILPQLGKEIASGKESQTELRLDLVQIPLVLDQTNGGEIFWM